MDAVLCRVSDLAEMECDAGDEGCPESIPQPPEPGQLFAVHLLARLDLDGDNGAVMAFQNEVDLVIVTGAPVTRRGGARFSRWKRNSTSVAGSSAGQEMTHVGANMVAVRCPVDMPNLRRISLPWLPDTPLSL